MLSPKKNRRISFLVPYPLGAAPGQRFRFEQYLRGLADEGFDIKLFPFLSTGTNEVLYETGHYARKIAGVLAGFARRLIHLPQILRAEWVFIFREATPLGPPVFEWLIGKVFRKKIIYDFDDAIWLPNTSKENKIVSWLKWHSKVESICRWSYKVSCGNAFLAEFARKWNNFVVINPTTIDTEALHNPSSCESKSETNEVVIGWTGTRSTMRYLAPVLECIESMSKKYPDLRFIVIADKRPDWSLTCLRFIPWNKQTEIADLMKIDIGIMPLEDDAWSRGKCGFKALQYMSLEKPALVSPVGVNTEIVDHGINGFLCKTTEEWHKHLEQLILDRHLREGMGRNGREKVISTYSLKSNTPNFLSLFK